MLHNVKALKRFRRDMRNEPTSAEGKLWKCLQRSHLGVKFRRQHSVGRYILDFHCTELKLAVELDGEGHGNLLAAEADSEREAFLKRHNIVVLTFENQEVFDGLDFVLETIRQRINP